MIMRLGIMTARAIFDIMVHLPKEQSEDIGFLIYNLARLQHHSNKRDNVPRAVSRPVCFVSTVAIQKMESRPPSGALLTFIERVEMVILWVIFRGTFTKLTLTFLVKLVGWGNEFLTSESVGQRHMPRFFNSVLHILPFLLHFTSCLIPKPIDSLNYRFKVYWYNNFLWPIHKGLLLVLRSPQ